MDESARDRLRRALSELAGVRLAFLFGSRARGEARAASDFDVAVLVDAERARDERGALLRRILGRLGREVASTQLDLVLLNDASPLLRHRVLRDGQVLFALSEAERPRFAREVIREYQDGAIRREAFTKRRIARLKGERTTRDGGPGDLLEKARGAARLLGAPARVPRR